MSSPSTYLEVPISLNLLNTLRNFTHEAHAYNHEFLEHINDILLAYLKRIKKAPEVENSLLEETFLGLHYYLSLIDNIEGLITMFHADYKLDKINTKAINSSNIFNIYSLWKAIHAVKQSQSQQDQSAAEDTGKQVDLQFVQKFRIHLTERETKADSLKLSISSELLDLTINSRGHFDLDFVSAICFELNKAFDLDLHHYLLQDNDHQDYTAGFSKSAHIILNASKEISYTELNFQNHLKTFTEQKDINVLLHILSDIEHITFYVLLRMDLEAQSLLKRLFICLLGHKEAQIRERAIIYLNILSDGIDWQLKGGYKTRVSTVGSEFTVTQLVESEADNENLVFLLHSFPFDNTDEAPLLSWHKPEIVPFPGDSKYILASIDLGNFPRAGFYDWKFVRLHKTGKMDSIFTGMVESNAAEDSDISDTLSDISIDSKDSKDSKDSDTSHQLKVIQGRYVVHPKATRDMEIHEVYVDFPEGMPGEQNRGSFAKLRENLSHFSKAGINCLYLMGALERDFGGVVDHKTGNKTDFKRKDVSPMAVTCRRSINSLLGGPGEFSELVKAAKEKKMSVVLDCVTRVSSARFNRRYKDLVLQAEDEDGKVTLAYGGEGRARKYEETVYLNYRKKEAWDLLIEEAMELVSRYGIDGLYLDDAQTWPQLFEINEEELARQDTDGTEVYTLEDKFYGSVVNRKNFTGYWATEAKNKYANPIIVELCRRLWQKYPNLLLIGEAWGGQGYEQREINLIKSGVIPRMNKMTPAAAAIFGKRICKDGSICDNEALTVSSLRTWYEEIRKSHPSGAIVIQSTTGHSWPTPALLFKRGTWSFIDLMFFLPHIPMTFMNEIFGHAFRCPTVKRFQTQLEKSAVPVQAGKRRTRKTAREAYLKAVFDAEENVLQPGNVQVETCMCARDRIDDFLNCQRAMTQELGPEFGFDLNKIHLHYEHRRQLRKKLGVLRTGKMVALVAEHAEGYHSHVLAFARVEKAEMAIIATNCNDYNVYFDINMKSLKYLFHEFSEDVLEHCVIRVVDHDGQLVDDHYTVYEFLNGKIATSLKPFSSLVWGATIITNDKELHAKTLVRSLERIKAKIAKNQFVDGNEVVAMLINTVKEANSVQKFANNLGYIYSKFLKAAGISLPQILNSIKEFHDDSGLVAKLFAFCALLNEQNPISPEDIPTRKRTVSKAKTTEANIDELLSARPRSMSVFGRTNPNGLVTYTTAATKPGTDYFTESSTKPAVAEHNEMKTIFDFVHDILDYNTLGGIAFITPELGRWSTQGGLGVMVDELSVGLAVLGEEVICVSPYYEKNRKGETGYLEKDPDGITHVFDLEVLVGDEKYTVGVFQGIVKGVTLYFLQNAEIFPIAYAEKDVKFTVQQLTVMAKASLELFCVIKKVPSLIVTNDWFTALTPAYPKHGHFGELFKKTKFLHIAHNLDPTYEGRLYPNPHDGFLENVHGLPTYLFVDPFWRDRVFNPSRCALLTSDQWATVSFSYKQELMDQSPLSSLLREYQQPFAFPNGIPKETRLQRIVQVCNNDHLKAKEMLQKKYFKLDKLDNSLPIFAFVGRITQQKGVHLILENLETIIKKFNGKVQFIVGGMANMKDPYGSYCAGLMQELSNQYPNNLWASPTEFFVDGCLVNAGADFGLMPSLFEPGGIVQQEFFVGSTPVIAFQTGGLKDTVFEFDQDKEKGNGFVFKEYNGSEYVNAVERAYSVYGKPEKYSVLRKNCFDSTIDVEDVSRAWDREFHRLFNKSFIDPVLMKRHLEAIDKSFDEVDYREEFTFAKVVAETSLSKNEKVMKMRKKYLKKRGNIKNTVFTYKANALPRVRNVQLVGTFNDWEKPIAMNYDHIMGKWSVTVPLGPGEYFYKFIVDHRWICSDDDPKATDMQGILNNYIQIL